MARKRPAPTELQSNELKLSVEYSRTKIPSAAEAAANVFNSHRGMRSRTAVSLFEGQQVQQQEYHQQQTFTKSRTKNSTSMTSSSAMSSMSATMTSSTAAAPPMQSNRGALMAKHWQDELMEFSTQITRQAHFTLARIAGHFRVNGMKFDTDFRDHYLYISNNRLVESYDSFLIGLPREMKSDEYQVQRPSTVRNAQPPQIPVNRQQSLEPPSKRKCIENGRPAAANGPAQPKQLAVVQKRSTARLSNSMSKIGPDVRIQKLKSAQKLANVTAPALNISAAAAATTTRTTTATTANQLKIKNVKSLQQPAITTTTSSTSTAANNSLNTGTPNIGVQKKSGGTNIGNVTPAGSLKKVHVVSSSKLPGGRFKVFVPKTPVPVFHVNAQSTPNRPANAPATKVNSIPEDEDPLRIDEETTESTIVPSINEGRMRPAYVKEVTLLQSNNKQLSTSLPTMTTKPPATPDQSNGIITRSRNINSEHPKRLYKCNLCAFTSEVEQNLMRHNLVHTGDKSQICKTCKKRFPRKQLLLAHMREHHLELHSHLSYWDLTSN